MAISSRRGASWLLLAASALALVTAWVLASPIGASPDEEAHIAYAWGTATRQTLDNEKLVTTKDRLETVVQMPPKLLQYPGPSCYAFRPDKPVTQCSPVLAANGPLVSRASYMSRYPPLFYAAEGIALRAGVAADLSGPRVLYGARIFAAVLNLLVAGYGIFLLARRFPDSVVLLATLLALPAMAWFMAGSVNPNGLEITAAFLLASGVLALRVDHGAGVRSTAAVLAVPLGTLLVAWARPLSFVWASLILMLLLVPTDRGDGRPWRSRLPVRSLGIAATVGTVLALFSSMAWFVYALGLRIPESALRDVSSEWEGRPPFLRVLMLILHSGTVVFEQIGVFGWLDTPLPSLVVIAWVSVAAVATVLWWVGRNTLVPHWAIGAVLGIGYLSALLDEYRRAWGWQGRYLLPLTAAVCVLAVPGLTAGLRRLSAIRRVVPWMLGLLVAVNVLSVVWFLFRNVYGFKAGPRRLPSAPGPVGAAVWMPPLGQGVVLALAVLAFACAVLAVWTFHRQHESDATRHE